MKNFRRALILGSLVVGCGFGLAACGSETAIKRDFGLTRDAPDEFQVTTRAPLQMPPNDTLPAPRPGDNRPQELPLSQQAEAVLVPDAALARSAAPTPSEKALVAKAGPAAPRHIRADIDRESIDAKTPGMLSNLAFWQATKPPGTVIDPGLERQRLAPAAQAAKPASDGPAGTDSGGFFDWLF